MRCYQRCKTLQTGTAPSSAPRAEKYPARESRGCLPPTTPPGMHTDTRSTPHSPHLPLHRPPPSPLAHEEQRRREGGREGEGSLTSREQRIPMTKHAAKPLILVSQLNEDVSVTWNFGTQVADLPGTRDTQGCGQKVRSSAQRCSEEGGSTESRTLGASRALLSPGAQCFCTHGSPVLCR